MILDKGICTVYRKTDVSGPGAMPVWEDVAYHTSWYGELDFETRQARPTEGREEIRCDARIRVLQDRRINNHDRVELQTSRGETLVYEVTRAFHGVDDESGELISDLSLEVYTP